MHYVLKRFLSLVATFGIVHEQINAIHIRILGAGRHRAILWGANWRQDSIPRDRSNFCSKANMEKLARPSGEPKKRF
jgi:hypothetical protein